MKKASLFLTLLLAIFLFRTAAQNPEWINYTDGRFVVGVALEGNFVWCVTQGGPARLDMLTGKFTFYNKANSGLPDNQATSLAIDGSGNKWIGTTLGGLAKFDGADWTVYNASNSPLPNDTITVIAIDGNGTKWIGTASDGLVKFDGAGWTVYNAFNSSPSLYYSITSIAIDGSGNKWIGTAGGRLVKFDGLNWAVYNSSNSGLPGNGVTSIAIDGNGNKWIGTWGGGLVKFDGANWTVYNSSNLTLPDNYIYSLAIDGNGNKWMGTGGGSGLVKFDGANWTAYNSSNSGLPTNYIYSLAIDGNGNKWIGTGGSGLAKFDGAGWAAYNSSNSALRGNWITSIAIDSSGSKWIGAWGIVKIDNSNWTFSPGPLWVNYEVTSIAIDDNGNIWIGTWGGEVAKFDGANWAIAGSLLLGMPPYDRTIPFGITSIGFDNGGNVWASGWSNSLFKYDGLNWASFNLEDAGQVGNIVSMAVDSSGDVWAVTDSEQCLVRFDGANWIVYDSSNSPLPDCRVSSVAIDKHGNKWITTDAGLWKFDGDTWTPYSPSPSLHSHLAFDDNGNIWASGWNGLVKFDGLNSSIYNSGLPPGEITSIAIDDHGNKWIGINGGGLAVFREGGVIVSVEEQPAPAGPAPSFLLEPIYPNPFNAATTIQFTLAQPSFVRLAVYDLYGCKISMLLNEKRDRGRHQIVWEPKGLAAGIYVVRLETPAGFVACKVALVK